MPAEPRFVPPERLGSWSRVRWIKDGSMASLWLYSKSVAGRKLESAVKVIAIDHPETRRALENEVHKLLEISSSDEHIVTLYDVQELDGDGRIALFTEYVPGETTLRDIIRNHAVSPMPESAVAEVLRGILKGMAHAHRHGIMHHDLWPSNVMVRPPKGSDGLDYGALMHSDIRLIDFGIARSHEDESTFTAQDIRHLYVAPELFLVGERGTYNDVYCIGLILYELLTGEKPNSDMRERNKLSTSEGFFRAIYLRVRNFCESGAAMAAFRLVLPRSLEFDPKDRYKDASEMLEAFEGGAAKPGSKTVAVQASERAATDLWQGTEPPVIQYDVYAGGCTGKTAVVWKNGSVHWHLTNGSHDANVLSLFAFGSDLYAGGCDGKVATVWKNGRVHSRLTSGKFEARVHSLFVAGKDVYAVGYEKNQRGKAVAMAWKNGRVQWHLTDGGRIAEALSIFVSEGNVFAAGYDGKVAVVWKNGIVHWQLTDGDRNARVQALFVSDGVVYTGGWENGLAGNGIATVWRNGGLYHRLTNGDYEAKATSLFVSGNDVYAGGREDNAQGEMVATVWKNGCVFHRLASDGYDARVFALFVLGNDVYTGGIECNPQGRRVATVWRNGYAHWRMTGGGDNTVVNSLFAMRSSAPENPKGLWNGGIQTQDGAKWGSTVNYEHKATLKQAHETAEKTAKPRVLELCSSIWAKIKQWF